MLQSCHSNCSAWCILAGSLHLIRGMLCCDGSNAAQEAELDAVARQPRPWHAGASQADQTWASPSHCLWREWPDSNSPAAFGHHLLRPELGSNACGVCKHCQLEANFFRVASRESMCSREALSFLSNVREVSPHTPCVRSISDTAAVAHHEHHRVLCTTSLARQCSSMYLT